MIAAKIFLKEKLTKIKIFSLLLSIIGLVLIFDMFALGSIKWNYLITGNILALIAGFFFAGRNIFSRKLSYLSEYKRTFWMFLVGAIILFFLNLLYPSSFSIEQLPLIILYLMILGLGIQLISMLLVQYAFACMEASKASVILLLEVVTGSLTACLIGGQIPSMGVISGGILIMLSCIFIIKA